MLCHSNGAVKGELPGLMLAQGVCWVVISIDIGERYAGVVSAARNTCAQAGAAVYHFDLRPQDRWSAGTHFKSEVRLMCQSTVNESFPLMVYTKRLAT